MGEHLIVLNSSEVAMDLLERRSVVYADRVRKHFGIQFTTSVLTGAHRQPRMPMFKELYVSSFSSAITPANDLFQDGVHLGLTCHALWEPLACPPSAVPPFFQHFGRQPVRRQGPQGGKCLPPSAL